MSIWVERIAEKQMDFRKRIEELWRKYEREEQPPEDFPKGFRETGFTKFESLFPEFREVEKTQYPEVSPGMAFEPYAKATPLYNPFREAPPIEPVKHYPTPFMHLPPEKPPVEPPAFGRPEEVVEVPQMPKLTWLDKVREIKADPVKLVPFVSSGVEIYTLSKLLKAAKDLEDGREVSKEDLLGLKEYVDRSLKDKDWGYKFADILAQLVPFAGEFIATGGIFAFGKTAAVKASTVALKRLATKTGAKILERKLAQLGVEAVGTVAGGTLRALAIAPVRVPAGTLRKQLETTLIGDEESVFNSAKKAFGEHWVEIVSESTGGAFGVLSSPIKGQLIKIGLFKAFLKANPTKRASDVSRVFNRLGYHGVLGEMFEERVADVMHGVLEPLGLSDQKFSIPSMEQLSVELAAFSVPGVTAKAISEFNRIMPTVIEQAKIAPEAGFVRLPGKPEKEKPEITPVTPEVTLAMKEQLREMTGWSRARVEKLTPAEAYEMLGMPLPAIPKAEAGMPEAGYQPAMIEGVTEKEVRPIGKGIPTQIRMDEFAKLQAARGVPEKEAYLEAQQATARLEGLKETLANDPVAQAGFTIGGKKVDLTHFISLREQTFPEYFTVKEAQALFPGQPFTKYTEKGLKRYNKVPKDEALDDLSKRFGMSADEIANRVMAIRAGKATIRQLEREVAVSAEEAGAVAPPRTLAEPKTLTDQVNQIYDEIKINLAATRASLTGLRGEEAQAHRTIIRTLEKELSNLDKLSAVVNKPANLKSLRQKIMAVSAFKGLPETQRRALFRKTTGISRLTSMTQTQLEETLEAVRRARPTKIRGKNVLKLQTEKDIQSLKAILIKEQRLTPEIYESIKGDLQLPTDKFVSADRFITEREGRELIREMNYEAESGLAEWDAGVTNALVEKPEIKASIDKLSDVVKRENLPLPKRRVKMNWRKFAIEISEVPDDVGLSGTMSILRALRRFQEQLGGRSATRIYDISEMMVETRQLNEVRLTQRISEMKAEVPSLIRIVQDEKSMGRVQQWLDADLAIAKVEKPADITDAELEVAKLFRKEYDQWKDVVRFERFKDAYYQYKGNAELIVSGTERTGDVAIADAPLADIKKAIEIYESQGETALNEFLKTKTWGVLKSGYSFSQVIHPQLRIGQRISVRATTTSLHQRKGLEFRKDERTSWERLIAYERQMIGLNLQPFFRKMDREFSHIVAQGRLADPSADGNKISLFLREVKGFPIESPVVRILLRLGGWSFGTLSKVPWMSVRNLHQNIAFHPDKAEVLRALTTGGFFGNPTTRAGRFAYTNALVHQFRGVMQEQLLMGYMGKTPIENLIRVSDYYHLSDKLNRTASMAGSGAKADRALKAFQKDGNAEKFLRNSGANELSLTEQIRILEYLAQPNYDYGGALETVSGGEAAIRDVAKKITTLTHFNYTRYLRSTIEMGEVGRVFGSLVAFPRSVAERYSDFFSRLRPSRKLSGVARRRAVHSLLAMVIGSAVASVMLSAITGKKRDAYNPLLVLQWQVGGLAIGSAQELNELYRHLSNLAFTEEESQKDYAMKELAILIPRLGDMFIPFYAPTMNAIEALYDERYIDRKTLRQLRAMFDESYKPNLEFYEKERTTIEAWQHGLFGTRTPDPSDLEQSLIKLKGVQEKLGKIDEEAVAKDTEERDERLKELLGKDEAELTLEERRDLARIKAFRYDPSDYIFTTSNLGSDFNSAIKALDPTVITLENGFSPLLLDYLEYQEMFSAYQSVPADKRSDIREINPILDANLFLWGYTTALKSDTAEVLVKQMMERYKIPKLSIPGYLKKALSKMPELTLPKTSAPSKTGQLVNPLRK